MASYGTDEGFTTWLAEQGYTLPDGAPTSAVLRARGTAYVDGYEAYWTGTRTDGVAQELAWPRTAATMNCTVAIADDVIPPAVVTATYRAAWLEAQTPGVLIGSAGNAGSRVRRQKVESIEREFFDDGKAEVGSGPSFIDSQIDGLLSAFICDGKDGPFLWTLGN
ncbi:DnaT-like ssDNA-binding protein [Croceibacterium aestuarii]|uniref:DnaT-like ssDNA-binding protein n=1 Tax=Croceibacterium aestuarii TaxID=3064139 RepID=UPI00272DE339|nr:DnaT-like ssDNA-binding protein [Croceibacterium sp. D39]